MEIPALPHLGAFNWTLIIICGMLIGMSKVGVPGVIMIVVPVLAFIFGAKESTGVLLPILMMADIFGVAYYRRHSNVKYLIKVLPWAFCGLIIALWIGDIVDNEQFKNLIAILIFSTIILMIWQDYRRNTQFFPDNWWFAAAMGILGGFATMIGNVAGPVFAIYLLAMHLPKKDFIGTSAWFFLIINFTKFPLQLLVWDNITIESLSIDLITLPAIALGAFAGYKLVGVLSEKTYRGFVIIITALSGLLLFI